MLDHSSQDWQGNQLIDSRTSGDLYHPTSATSQPSGYLQQPLGSNDTMETLQRQDTFDVNGWPEGIERPNTFLGIRVRPISQWSIKHIFCLSY